MKHEQRFGDWQYTDQQTGHRLTLRRTVVQQCGAGRRCQREGGKCTACGDPKRGKDGQWDTVTPRPKCPTGCKEFVPCTGYCVVCGDGYHVPVEMIRDGGHVAHWMACVQTKPWNNAEILGGLRQALSAVLRARGVDSGA